MVLLAIRAVQQSLALMGGNYPDNVCYITCFYILLSQLYMRDVLDWCTRIGMNPTTGTQCPTLLRTVAGVLLYATLYGHGVTQHGLW